MGRMGIKKAPPKRGLRLIEFLGLPEREAELLRWGPPLDAADFAAPGRNADGVLVRSLEASALGADRMVGRE